MKLSYFVQPYLPAVRYVLNTIAASSLTPPSPNNKTSGFGVLQCMNWHEMHTRRLFENK
jgi:hypothetical protein